MESRHAVIFAVVAFLSVLQGSNGIRCYQCSSRGVSPNLPNNMCADPIDKQRMFPVECNTNAVRELNKFLTDISQETTGIIEQAFQINYNTGNLASTPLCQKLDVLVDGHYNYTIRSCVNSIDDADKHCGKIMALNNNAFKTTYCGICSAEGCNGSPSLASSLLLSVALPAALVAFLASSWTRA